MFVDTHVCRRGESLNASTSNRYSYIGDCVHFCPDVVWIDRPSYPGQLVPGYGEFTPITEYSRRYQAVLPGSIRAVLSLTVREPNKNSPHLTMQAVFNCQKP